MLRRPPGDTQTRAQDTPCPCSRQMQRKLVKGSWHSRLLEVQVATGGIVDRSTTTGTTEYCLQTWLSGPGHVPTGGRASA